MPTPYCPKLGMIGGLKHLFSVTCAKHMSPCVQLHDTKRQVAATMHTSRRTEVLPVRGADGPPPTVHGFERRSAHQAQTLTPVLDGKGTMALGGWLVQK